MRSLFRCPPGAKELLLNKVRLSIKYARSEANEVGFGPVEPRYCATLDCLGPAWSEISSGRGRISVHRFADRGHKERIWSSLKGELSVGNPPAWIRHFDGAGTGG